MTMNEKYREVTLEERRAMADDGVFDINGNIPAHPGYTGIHKRRDGFYYFRGVQITDPESLAAIERRNDPPAPPAQSAPIQRQGIWGLLCRLVKIGSRP